MTKHIKAALAIAAAAMATGAMAEVTLYGIENLRGPAVTARGDIANLQEIGFNDRASSLEVRGDRRDRWEVCEGAGYNGRCAVVRPGAYNDLRTIGLNNRISSIRQIRGDDNVADNRYAPAPVYGTVTPVVPATPVYRRDTERLFEVPVSRVRAVVAGGPSQQHCWIEREQVMGAGPAPSANVGGAVAGALIGGILGHQIGGGSGRDAATALGAIGGAAIGSNSGTFASGPQVATQDVQRCERVVNTTPDYYDVTYYFEGREHRVQMRTAPGSRILVDADGVPRG